MIRRARWTRPLSALFALWFALVLGDPGLSHACPMHGGHTMAGAATSAGAPHHDSAHGTHAASRHDSSRASSHDGSHHGGTGPCTCVGQCCMTAAVAPLPTVAAMHVPTVVVRAEPARLVAFVVAPAAPDTRLPFANGPPTA